MKIAVVGPSPVPFTIGGAENLIWGLCNTINQKTPHQAELIKLPSKELDFWSLIENYYAFYNLDLNHFDLVISTKYPSWMVRHRNSICYMVHTLRGLYDTYHFMKMPDNVEKGNEKIDKILNYMDSNSNPNSLDEFFSMLFDLKDNSFDVPAEYFAFPAPFIRKIIHYMDRFGLSQQGVRKICAISETVKRRKEYYPPNADVEVVYPPSTLTEYTSGEYQYVFMISRLDAPKRIDMLIEAMKYVKSNVRLLIAGTGPQEAQLKKLAADDKRIEFLGYVNDEDVEKYYSNSLVIPYFPYDEDYGLITIEAMLHKKPVITTVDAGGPTEFVINKETGFVTKFDPKAIAEKIDYFANNPSEAKRMGINGYNKVKKMTWDNMVCELLSNIDDLPLRYVNSVQHINKKRKKITVTSTFPIYPPQGGGQVRTYQLYKNLSKKYDIDIISLTNEDQKRFNNMIANGLRENRIPKSGSHQRLEYEMEKKVGFVVSDIANLELISESASYCNELQNSIKNSEVIILSHPYLFNEAKKYIKDDQIIIYEAQDVEYLIKKEMLPKNETTKKLLQKLYSVEKECCEVSRFIMTCSEKDKKDLSELYNISLDKIIVVPNGVDCKATTFTSMEQRIENKKVLGLANEKIGLFMGSWHKPNLEAAEEIIKIAYKCPDVKFLLMGSQCAYFEKKKLPSNVGLLGVVGEETKSRIFSVVDFALNPMLSGSGTNLKMFDYISAGIPVITTEFGSRGIDSKDAIILAEINEMHITINNLDIHTLSKMVCKSRQYVESNFDWSKISSDLIIKLSEIIS
ncbi:glycosyltransferase [Lachnospiraceae bacterium MD1]|uniref:Glycosyltransferase n=1 Tax=Variimorphobacter saccharofermentans TaxID=2755051 RepID=A0A839JYU3_9FIRM|nr:glycosyltransferase [Variimorphobacter saccharofermentans]MBB2182843.1 glycosyltransferase [Variimorphobacter saccharofermentans]